MNDPRKLTIVEARKALDDGSLTSVELVKDCLQAIEKENSVINAFLEVWTDLALKQAEQSDARRKNGEVLGLLDGIPIGIKDNILVEGQHCSAASKILQNYIAVRDATVIRKLKDQGAVFIGRTNMDEFAMGGSTENSAYGVTRNPHDTSRVPGGSSGGSAAAVSANFCLAALGSDTGGSIRQPSAFCGLVGLKPTYGRVSRSGLMAMASSFDQIGPIAKTAEDASILFEAIYGKDGMDQTTVDGGTYASEWRKELKGLRIGLPRQAWGEGISEDVRDSVLNAVEVLKNLGAEIIDVDLPFQDEVLAVYYVVMPSEVSANMSRFDGIRFGIREPGRALLETYLDTRGQHLGMEVKRRILLGAYALSSGYYDAYYKKAKQVQTLIRNAYQSALLQVDAILTPTTPSTAFEIGEKINDPLAMYLEDLFTVGANVSGLPAVSFPSKPSGTLPVGVHITGRAFSESTLFAIAKAYKDAVAE